MAYDLETESLREFAEAERQRRRRSTWESEMADRAADALDRLAASLAAKDAEIANLRADLEVKEIATDEAMAQGERQRAEIEAQRHIANEWADMATNGLQWLTNIRDGVSSPQEAVADMQDNLARIRALAALAEQEAKGPHGG